ncbi:N-acetylmuramoyl-L-alanine amidase [Psychromarinibacter sp. C21-152]|uniref:N-acetylmuramoyl-L-alanine amidase n=1 Tax=Psychromarinibacter sediminicola TaxID=3033385 RepID=A0AAE3T709_9RHOB|nr:N-acetylmuramoyl-L-alanine amidase [Psychromarinibacter sediminicola]MDF0599870.1 N-acetylmuramoyl-L-alanine amidase [Psychromarinibacter sediminicola]
MVVLHFTAMRDCAAALERLCDRQAQVSAHYLIAGDGRAYHLVDEDARAWHAGAGQWGEVSDVNSRSIGIELDNPGDCPFAEPQVAALERLLAGICARWRIPPERVIGHSDMAPTRKTDPGPRFDWRRLALQGLSVWPAAPLSGAAAPFSGAADPRAFAAAATRFGYAPELDHDTMLAAFRLRFRPWAEGPLAPVDCAAAADLARRFPVDRAAANA